MPDDLSSRSLICPDCGEVYAGARGETCPEDGALLQEMPISDDTGDDPLIGEVLERRFSIQELVGEGSMARVYRATQLSVHREVALKILDPGHSTDTVLVERFYREAQIISDFSHPNIVRLFDFGRDEEHEILYLAMEHVDGYPVERLVRRGRLVPALAVELAIQICGALAEVHSHGVVHRDLKPENLMVVPRADGELEVKLLDFGIAHALQRADGFTEPGEVWGTPHYLAPEQAEAEEVGAYSDLYSLGIMLFEMLTGRAPTSGEKSMEILYEHVEGDLPDIRQFLGEEHVCDDLVELVRRLLSTDPEDRPQYALEVRERLRAIAEEQDYAECRVDPSKDREAMFTDFIRPAAPSGDQEPPHTPLDRTRVETPRSDQPRELSDSAPARPGADVQVPASGAAFEDSAEPASDSTPEEDGDSGTELNGGPSVDQEEQDEQGETPADESTRPPSDPGYATESPSGGRRWMLAALGTVLAVAGGGVVVYFWADDGLVPTRSGADTGRAAEAAAGVDSEERVSPRDRTGASADVETPPDADDRLDAESRDAGRRDDASVDVRTGDGGRETGETGAVGADRVGSGGGRDEASGAPSTYEGAGGGGAGAPDPSPGGANAESESEGPTAPPAETAGPAGRDESEPEDPSAGGAAESDGESSSDSESDESEQRVDPGLYPVE